MHQANFQSRRSFQARGILLLAALGLILGPGIHQGLSAKEPESGTRLPETARRILFLGDSITYAGHYIVLVEAALRQQSDTQDSVPDIINLGLPSETCTGLSEPDHPFPRPNVHERLDRALKQIQPDLVVACYGMNDGIYHPFNLKRFQSYQQGMLSLARKVKAAGARLVLMTPPPFDPLPQRISGKLRKAGAKSYAWFGIYENYDQEVIKPYAEWILDQKAIATGIVNLRKPVLEYVEAKRKTNPGFALSGDGVHLNQEGNEILASAILKAWGYQPKIEPDKELLALITQRQTLMRNAWLTKTGHKRPGIKAGHPMDKAQARNRELIQAIHAKLK